MHKTIRAAVAAVMLLMTPALAETRTLELPAFTRIEVSGGLEVTVEQGPQAVLISADKPDDLDELETDVHKGLLRVGREWNVLNPITKAAVRLKIVTPEPTLVFARDASSIYATHIVGDRLEFHAAEHSTLIVLNVRARDLTLSSRDGSDLIVRGVCNSGTVFGDSGGSIDAAGLYCADVYVSAKEGANLDVRASISVDGRAEGNSSIEIGGSPGSQKLSASGGSLIRAVE